MLNPMDLTDKKILVVGAETETEKVIVKQLISFGAQVLLIEKEEADLIKIRDAEGCENVAIFSFDIYENSTIEPNFELLSKQYGSFDGFLYCAGIGGVRPLGFTKIAFINEMMNANLYTFIEMVRCITRKNNFSHGGSIVAVSSISSIKGLKSKTAYCSTKAALDASVRCMAAELAEKGIRVNSILKGWLESDMNKDFIKNNMELSLCNDFQKQILGAIQPVELANTIAFLLSDSTRTITGISLLLDGGYNL